MIGTVAVSDLELNCIIGIRPSERTMPQPLLVDFEIDYDIEPAATTGDISHAVDYGEAARALVGFIESSQFGLLESLAAGAVEFLRVHVERSSPAAPKAVRISVTARKPQALSGRGVPSVTLEQRYGDEGGGHNG